MRNGTYGICKVTGKPIPLARLQALPYATTRVDAQRALERATQDGYGGPDLGALADPEIDIDPAALSEFELA